MKKTHIHYVKKRIQNKDMHIKHTGEQKYKDKNAKKKRHTYT
jgi:hypothetical protein